MRKKKIYKILFLVLLCGYIIYTFINQQQILNTYKADAKRYSLQIEEAKLKNSNLIAKKNNVKTIFFEELVSPKVAEIIAKEVNAKTEVLNPLESLSEDQIKKGEDYFSVMEENLQVLYEAIK